MGLTQKILLFTSLLIVALVAATVGYTTVQADRLAHAAIRQALTETREVWKTFEADRYNKLKLGVRGLASDPYFKAEVETRDEATVLDSLNERGADLKADFFVATDAAGVVIARSDRPGGHGENLAKDPMVAKALEGEEPATVWKQGERLFHAVALPMQTGGELKGVLIAGYGLSEGLAHQIRRLTKSEAAFLAGAGSELSLAASSLGPREAALRSALGQLSLGAETREDLELDLDGERFVAGQGPPGTARGGPGSVMVGRRDERGSRAGPGRRALRGGPGPAGDGQRSPGGAAAGAAQPERRDGGLPAVPAEPPGHRSRGHGSGSRPGLAWRLPHHRPGAQAGDPGGSGAGRLLHRQGGGGERRRDRGSGPRVWQPADRSA